MDQLKRSFAPVVDEATRVLVLGSLPGEESLARRQYYGNPRNHFWRLMEGVTSVGLVPLPYEERLDALRAAGIGLWDAVGSATRRGSLDGDIRGHSVNALASLVALLPALVAVGFNGAKSAQLGLPQLAGRDLALLPLPSSSPAFTLPFDAKLERWMALRPFLAGHSSWRKD
ncbi:MAG: DNA-deoxyinosine glycosylase [Alphaproteobacteria bacterium]|nr:DNA-deoxyinosine glycosylase [Alphaproteobacteria bacterium]MBV9372422.1 DNA-deoxyinosine glycosylase [Alphaproteobacteria bacterium]MBV9899482.1 DNA-deoxyinosine glycosylase [Alphaproteobacteria bacterium]